MPAALHAIDGIILQFCGASQVVCNHVGTGVHQRHAKAWTSMRSTSQRQRQRQRHHHEVEHLPSPVDDGNDKNNGHNDVASSAMDVDDAVYIPEPHGPDHEVVPVADLWNAISSSPFYQVNETCDLYEELQSALASGEQIFSMPLAPASEETSLDDETDSNFGIELLVAPDNPAYPWPTKAICFIIFHYITALLFSSPRLPFSEAQKKAVLSWARELGACDVPSLYALNRVQESVRTLVGNPTEKITARSGNIFYLNNVGKAVAKDYANPLTRFAMQDYPEDGDKGMSQVFNGDKMMFELPSPPAAKVDGEIYFVNELLQDVSGDYFIPEHFFLASDEREMIPTSNFRRSFREISANDNELACGLTESSNKYVKLVPNPLRTKSQGRMVYSVPLIIFMDDVSGNISKQWNKHHAIYMSNANLPREMLEKEFCIRFVTSSPHAAPMEMMSAMQDSIRKAMESGVFSWDCKHEEEVMLELYGLFLGGDNPMHAEECSHAGLHCNFFCRTCEVGGTKEYKESDEGYKSIFVPGTPRTPAGTAEEIHAQFASALCSGVKDTRTAYILDMVVELGKKLRKRGAGIQAKPECEVKAILEKQLGDLLQGSMIEGAINPLLGVEGFNVHQDTPTEILHMVLLGVIKYFWGQSVYLLEKAKLLDVFQMRLDSIEKDGLNAPCLDAEYICHYKGGLIGKHFKSLAQVMPFLIQDLLPRTVLDGWTSIGELVVYVWHTEIDDTDLYLAKLTRTINDFLNITAKCAPSILISKLKFHFLVHLPAYIRRFGPAILFSTERYESFNYVFRLACIHSNRQGPSQDMCKIFARQDIIKHIATGGYWFDSARGKWVRAGDVVLNYLDNRPEQARLLGIHTREHPVAGTGQLKKVAAEDGRPMAGIPVLWTATCCANALELSQPACNARYHHGISLILGNGEKASLEAHIIFHNSSTSCSAIGRIHEILISDSHKVVQHVAIQKLAFGPALHPLLHIPALELTDHEVVIGPQEIALVNVTFVKSELRLHIQSVIPQSLRKTPLRVDNAVDIRLAAACQIREKKASKKSGETPDTESLSTLHNDIAGVPAAFDRPAARKPKKTQKAKEKAPRPPANPRQPTITQAAASSSSHLPAPAPSRLPSLHLPATVPSQLQQSPMPPYRAPPSHHPLQLPPMVLTWQSSPTPGPYRAPPSHHLLQPPPMVMTWQSSPAPGPSRPLPSHPWPSNPPSMVPPMYAGQYVAPPYRHSLGLALPNPSHTPPLHPHHSGQLSYAQQLPLQPSAPVMTSHIWHSQAPHHEQPGRQY
ncbi:uncharacterized protein EDB91DRAFT_1250472 [Suillus paluster]|uniref:uncharacterized protein n=1 Tax=Suillus paluster TaxID=48578 RepID=UPI001B86E492|nr:uncharacterized protein EDB91DRAFT_1250472 [Suillus paluster]KAG1735638.1 hypothetical protein EDB91DRAFT_1250472 [Suillus paluster]